MRILGWTDDPDAHEQTVEKLFAAYAGQRPARSNRSAGMILLTSGATGAPKGATRSGGGIGDVESLLDRTPW